MNTKRMKPENIPDGYAAGVWAESHDRTSSRVALLRCTRCGAAVFPLDEAVAAHNQHEADLRHARGMTAVIGDRPFHGFRAGGVVLGLEENSDESSSTKGEPK